jgi:hypothetical protein
MARQSSLLAMTLASVSPASALALQQGPAGIESLRQPPPQQLPLAPPLHQSLSSERLTLWRRAHCPDEVQQQQPASLLGH